MGEELKKAVIYARYSCENQREESIEGQIREIEAFAKNKGYVILHRYIDRAISAKSDRRPQFQMMINDSRKKEFNYVLVWKVDRFSRNRYDAAKYKNILKKNKVKLVSATEPMVDGPEGILLESLLDGMAEYYSADLAQKVSRGMTDNALKGLYNGGVCPLGYRKGADGKFAIDEEGAKIVREIFDLYGKQGYTIPYIAKKYEGTGILRPNGKPISTGSVLCILKNEKYVGVYTFHDVRNEKGIPPIVDRETFDMVKDRLRKNARCPRIASENHDFILTGKLRCGKCGQIMSAEESRKKNSGKHYSWYICGNKKRLHACDMRTVDKAFLEQAVLALITDRFNNPEAIGLVADKIASKQTKSTPAMDLMWTQLNDVEKRLANVMKAIEAGVVNDTTKARMEELEATKKALQKSMAEENLLHRAYTRDEIMFMLTRLLAPHPKDLREKKLVIRLFLDSAVLFPDGTLTCNMNWLKGEKPIDINVFLREYKDSTLMDSCSP